MNSWDGLRIVRNHRDHVAGPHRGAITTLATHGPIEISVLSQVILNLFAVRAPSLGVQESLWYGYKTGNESVVSSSWPLHFGVLKSNFPENSL